jgi:tetratricopeptide (TPR) repeat protein
LTFAAVAAVIVTLAIGLIATLIQTRIARAQRALAESRFAEIRKLANSFLFEFDGAISDLAGATTARQLVVRKALEYLNALAKESQGDIQLQSELATAYERVGDIQGNPMSANLGDRAGALRSYREALRIWASISARPNQAGNAETHLVEVHRSMGDVLAEDQRHQEALPEYQSALALLEKRTPGRSQKKLVLMGRIGTELAILGRPEEGAQWGQRAVEEARSLLKAGMDEETLHDISALYSRAGRALLRAGVIDAAAAMFLEEIDACKGLVALVPVEKNSHYRRDLALAYQDMGDAQVRKSHFGAGLALYEQTRGIYEDLLRVDAANSQNRRELSIACSRAGDALTRLGDLAGAERALTRDLTLGQSLLKDDPTSSAYRRMHSSSLFQMGELVRKQARTAESRRYYLQQADVLRPIENATDKTTQRQLLNCYRALGEIETDRAVASAYLNKALAAAQKAGDEEAGAVIRRTLAALPH